MTRGLIGGALIGGRSLDGEIRNQRARASAFGVVLDWEHEILGSEAGHRFAVGIDGELQGVTTESRMTFPPPEDGEHVVEALAIRPETKRIPSLRGQFYGPRAWLRWPASESADCRAYQVFASAAPGGAVQYGTPVGINSGTVVDSFLFERPHSGTGTGLLSAGGTWSGAAVNQAFTVEIGAGGTWRHDVSGTWSAWRAIRRGAPNELGGGVRVTFESAAGDYVSGDTWTIHVGPPREWLSGELSAGVWTFSVAPVDAAGNVGAPLSERGVTIVRLPLAPLNVAAAWTDEGKIRLTWELPADASRAAIWIFSNYSLTFNRLGEYALEDGPWVELEDDAEEYEFAPPEAGAWKFYVRAVDSDGRVSDNIALVEADTTAPPDGVELNEPGGVEVEAGPDGLLTVRWVYDWNEGGSCTEFHVYAHEDEGAPVWESPDVIEVSAGSGVMEYSASAVYAGARWFCVRASDGTVETQNEDLTLGTPDSEAPTLSGVIEALPE